MERQTQELFFFCLFLVQVKVTNNAEEKKKRFQTIGFSLSFSLFRVSSSI